jgi:hypothetical protein
VVAGGGSAYEGHGPTEANAVTGGEVIGESCLAAERGRRRRPVADDGAEARIVGYPQSLGGDDVVVAAADEVPPHHQHLGERDPPSSISRRGHHRCCAAAATMRLLSWLALTMVGLRGHRSG